jgi:hypothetical protein
MASFQVCDALSILFKLEKPLVEHLKSFILLPREGGELFSELLIENSSSRTQKNSPIRSAKASASIVGRMFAVAIMNCYEERFIEVGTKSGLLGTVP